MILVYVGRKTACEKDRKHSFSKNYAKLLLGKRKTLFPQVSI